MTALIFIVETLLSLALFVVLARLLLQWHALIFRNPIAQAIVRLTNPLILPLRHILPRSQSRHRLGGGFVLVAIIKVGICSRCADSAHPEIELWLQALAVELVQSPAAYLLLRHPAVCIAQLIAQAVTHRLQSVLASVCEPSCGRSAPDSGNRGHRPVAAVGGDRNQAILLLCRTPSEVPFGQVLLRNTLLAHL